MIEEFIFPVIVGICVYLVSLKYRMGLVESVIRIAGGALLVAVIAVVVMVVRQILGPG